ncbi:MAG: tRNA (guanosine(46)-N7)-methyltransferase TrmB [Thermoanaerobaculia bacterium]|nr:tRNA (guanosine(46)-N7)-methyltransferase TrmB [Thermoanaerobaculia bacterium]
MEGEAKKRLGGKQGLGEALEPSSSHGINPRDRGLGRLDLEAEFGNRHPVILEIGSGKGRFLIDEALANPGLNYVGIEMALQYYRIVKDRIEKRDLPNVRIINYDATEVISKMLGDQSVREVHIYFPDPWPKKRQKKRRFVQDDALEQLARILDDSGSGLFVTDHQGYFEDSLPVFERWFRTEPGDVTHGEPRTNYEAKYREEGRPIYEIRFWKK